MLNVFTPKYGNGKGARLNHEFISKDVPRFLLWIQLS